ncbi:MAG: hypothetical protein U0414_02850 [Polyangiaceae bacterium]
MPRFLFIGALNVLLWAPRLALAQPVDQQKATAAQALFDQASDEMERKDFAAACPRLEEAVKLIPAALGARATLAECYEGQGKLASAWTQYTMVEGLATKSGERDRAESAGKQASALKPKLATLTLEVASGLEGLPGLVITRDGLEVGIGQAGVPLPVDVGAHEIAVSATGYKPWKKTIEVLADGAKTTTKIPMLEREAGPGAPAAAGGDRKWQTPVAVGLMIGGGVALGIGGLLGGLAIAKNDASNEKECDAKTDLCSPAGIEMRDQALGLGNGSTAMFVVGGVVAAGGLVLLLVPRGGGANTEKKTGSAWIVPTLGGALMQGTW